MVYVEVGQMTASVKSYRFYTEILQWLQENVGNILWSQPIISWHGEGWHIKSTPEVMPRGVSSRSCYTVTFEDDKKATMFALWT